MVGGEEELVEATALLLLRRGWRVGMYPSAGAFLGDIEPNPFGSLLLIGHGHDVEPLRRELASRGMQGLVVLTDEIPAETGSVANESLADRLAHLEALERKVRHAVSRHRRPNEEDRSTIEGTTFPVPLTRRETEVLALARKGLTSKLIARELGISYRTVEVHRTNLKRKLTARE